MSKYKTPLGNYYPHDGGRLLENYKKGVYDKAGKTLTRKGIDAIVEYSQQYDVPLPTELQKYVPKAVKPQESKTPAQSFTEKVGSFLSPDKKDTPRLYTGPTPSVPDENRSFREKFGDFSDFDKANNPDLYASGRGAFPGVGSAPPKDVDVKGQSQSMADAITEKYGNIAKQSTQEPTQQQAQLPSTSPYGGNQRIDISQIPKDKSDVSNMAMAYNKEQSTLGTAWQIFKFHDLATAQAKEYFKEMWGEENRAAEMEQELMQIAQEHPEIFDTEGMPLLKEMFYQSASIAPFMKNVIIEGMKKGAVGGLAAGGAALLLGQAGPQVATPEELVTVPTAATAGFKTGQTIGSFEESYMTEAGFAYKDMVDQGMSPDTARDIATIVGLANAGIELAQVGIILKKLPVVGKVLKKGISDASLDVAQRYVRTNAGKIFLTGLKEFGLDILQETGQEIAQEIVPIVGEIAGRKIEGDKTAKWSDVYSEENRQRILETATSTLKGMPGVLLFSNVSHTGGKYYNNYQSGKITKNINDSVGTVMAAANNPKFSVESKVKSLDESMKELKKVYNNTAYEEVYQEAKKSYTDLQNTKAQVQFNEVLHTVINKTDKSKVENSEFTAYENAKETLLDLKDRSDKTTEDKATIKTYETLLQDFDNLIDNNKQPDSIENKVQFMDNLDKKISNRALELYENSKDTFSEDLIGMPKIAEVIQRKDNNAKLVVEGREIPVYIEEIEYDGRGNVYARLKGSDMFVDMVNVIAPPTEQGKKEGFKTLREELIVSYESQMAAVAKSEEARKANLKGKFDLSIEEFKKSVLEKNPALTETYFNSAIFKNQYRNELRKQYVEGKLSDRLIEENKALIEQIENEKKEKAEKEVSKKKEKEEAEKRLKEIGKEEAKEETKKKAEKEKKQQEEEKQRQEAKDNIYKIPKSEYVTYKKGEAKQLQEYEHRQAVEKALKEGKEVPENVLKDYPDLAKETKKLDRPEKPSGKIFEKAFFEDNTEAQKQVDKWEKYLVGFKNYIENETPETFKITDGGVKGQYVIVHPSVRDGFQYQITIMDEDGNPTMHKDIKEKTDIAGELIELGYDNHENIVKNEVKFEQDLEEATVEKTEEDSLETFKRNRNEGLEYAVRNDNVSPLLDEKYYNFVEDDNINSPLKVGQKIDSQAKQFVEDKKSRKDENGRFEKPLYLKPQWILDHVEGGLNGELFRIPSSLKEEGTNHDKNIIKELTESMKKNGYDKEQPITITVTGMGEAWIYEGNHRLIAAKEVGIKVIPVKIIYYDLGKFKPYQWKPDQIVKKSYENESLAVEEGYITEEEKKNVELMKNYEKKREQRKLEKELKEYGFNTEGFKYKYETLRDRMDLVRQVNELKGQVAKHRNESVTIKGFVDNNAFKMIEVETEDGKLEAKYPNVLDNVVKEKIEEISLENVKTGKPFNENMYQGKGTPKEEIYNGVDYPILGKGQYYATTEENAKIYGEVSEKEVDLKNPLVISNDTQWRKLTKEAGWEYPNIFGVSEKKTVELIDKLQETIKNKGYDGVIIKLPMVDGHIDETKAKTMGKVLGHSQVVAFDTVEESTNKIFRYYTTQRPPAPGAIPKGAINVEMYDTKTDGAWGYVEYSEPLTEKQISDYELRPKDVAKIETAESAPTDKATETIDKETTPPIKETTEAVDKQAEIPDDVKYYLNNEIAEQVYRETSDKEGEARFVKGQSTLTKADSLATIERKFDNNELSYKDLVPPKTARTGYTVAMRERIVKALIEPNNVEYAEIKGNLIDIQVHDKGKLQILNTSAVKAEIFDMLGFKHKSPAVSVLTRKMIPVQKGGYRINVGKLGNSYNLLADERGTHGLILNNAEFRNAFDYAMNFAENKNNYELYFTGIAIDQASRKSVFGQIGKPIIEIIYNPNANTKLGYFKTEDSKYMSFDLSILKKFDRKGLKYLLTDANLPAIYITDNNNKPIGFIIGKTKKFETKKEVEDSIGTTSTYLLKGNKAKKTVDFGTIFWEEVSETKKTVETEKTTKPKEVAKTEKELEPVKYYVENWTTMDSGTSTFSTRQEARNFFRKAIRDQREAGMKVEKIDKDNYKIFDQEGNDSGTINLVERTLDGIEIEPTEIKTEKETTKKIGQVDVSDFTKTELAEVKKAGQKVYNRLIKQKPHKMKNGNYKSKADILKEAKSERIKAEETKAEQISKEKRSKEIAKAKYQERRKEEKAQEERNRKQVDWYTTASQRGLKRQITQDFYNNDTERMKNDLDKGRITAEEVRAVIKDAKEQGIFTKEEMQHKEDIFNNLLKLTETEITEAGARITKDFKNNNQVKNYFMSVWQDFENSQNKAHFLRYDMGDMFGTRLAGEYNANLRQQMMTALKGEKVPKAKSGITALKIASQEYFEGLAKEYLDMNDNSWKVYPEGFKKETIETKDINYMVSGLRLRSETEFTKELGFDEQDYSDLDTGNLSTIELAKKLLNYTDKINIDKKLIETFIDEHTFTEEVVPTEKIKDNVKTDPIVAKEVKARLNLKSEMDGNYARVNKDGSITVDFDYNFYSELSNSFKEDFRRLFKFDRNSKTWSGKSPYLANKQTFDKILDEVGLGFGENISTKVLAENAVSDFELAPNDINLLATFVSIKADQEINSNDTVNIWQKHGMIRLYINNSDGENIGYYSLDKNKNVKEFVEGKDSVDENSTKFYKELTTEIREKQGIEGLEKEDVNDEYTRSNFTKQRDRNAHRDLSVDEKAEYGRINVTRGRAIKKSEEVSLPASILNVLRKHQVDGTQSAIYAMDNYGGFILADGTGAGKTMQELATLSYYKQKGNSVIIVTEKQIIPNFKEQAELLGIKIELLDNKAGKLHTDKNTITITTYDSLKKLKDRADYIVFDESHNLKNRSSKKTQVGKSFASEAKGVMYASATPIDKTTQIQYLKETGIFDNVSFSKTMKSLGYDYVERRIGRRTIGAWERRIPQVEADQRLQDYFTELGNLGILIKREVKLDRLSVGVEIAPLDTKVHTDIENVGLEYGRNEAVRLMARRRYLEPYKIDKTIEVIEKKLAEGKKVVVFMDRVNDIKNEDGDVASRGTIQIIEEKLKERNIKTAPIYGAKSATKAIKSFNEGDARVAILTPQKGGAGISLDDTTGTAPRSMIIVTPPFSAMDNVQMVGRIVRLNTKSDTELTYILSDSYIDQWNFGIIAKKLSTLEAMVQGDIKNLLADIDSVPMGELSSSVVENRAETTLLDNYNYINNSGSENLIESTQSYIKEKALGREANTYMDNSTSFFNRTLEIPLEYVSENYSGGYNNEHNHLDSNYSKKKILSLKAEMKDKEFIGEPISIGIDYNGKAYVLEGFYRLEAAKSLGIEKVPIRLKYFDGGESVNKAFSPNNIMKQLDESAEKTKERLKEVDSIVTTKELKQDKELYKRARGNISSALRLVDRFIDKDIIKDLKEYKDAKIIPIIDKDNKDNAIPKAFALAISERTGHPIYTEVVKSNEYRGSKLNAIERTIEKPSFTGMVEKGQSYIIIDDILTKGSTIKKLIEYIHKKGGKVIRVVTLANSDSKILMATEETLNNINKKLGVENIEQILIEAGAIEQNIEELTEAELREIQGFETVDAARTNILEGRLGQKAEARKADIQGDAQERLEYGELGKQNLHSSFEFLVKKDKKELKNFHRIISELSKHFGVPVTNIGFRKRKATGYYMVIPRTVHLKFADDIKVALHEFGHHIDKKYNLEASHKSVIKSMIDNILTPAFAQNYKSHELPREAIAEFFKYYITNPGVLKDLEERDLSKSITQFREIVETELSKADFDKLMEARKDITRIYNKGIKGVMGSQMVSYGTNDSEGSSPKETAQRAAKRFQTFFFDENEAFATLEKYVEKTTGKKLMPSENPYRLALNTSRASQRAAGIIGMFDSKKGQTVPSLGPNLKPFNEKSFTQILQPVLADKAEFDLYLKNVRAVDLMNRNHKVFPNEISIEDIRATIENTELSYPEFKKTAEELYNWWDSFMIAWVVEPGFMKEEVWTAMKTLDPHYVPLFRAEKEYTITPEGKKIYSSSRSMKDIKTPISRLSYKGSGHATYSPTESMIIQITKIVDAQMKREVTLAMDNLYKKGIPGIGAFYSKTATPLKHNAFNAKETKMNLAIQLLKDYVKNEYGLEDSSETLINQTIYGNEVNRNKALRKLEDLGADRASLDAFTQEVREIMEDNVLDLQGSYEKLFNLLGEKGYSAAPVVDAMIDDIITWFTPKNISKEQQVISIIDKNGDTVFYEIHDKELLKLLVGMTPQQVSPVMKYLIGGKRIMTTLITGSNPFFAVFSNLPRDVVQGLVYGHENNPVKYAAGVTSSLASVTTHDIKNQTFKTIGGGFGYSLVGSQRDIIKEVYNKLNVDKANVFMRGIMAIEKFNDAVESGPRQVEFYKILNKSLAEGMSEYDALLEALYQSSDVTLNFMKKGSIMRIPIFRTIPFFNAGLQGLDKLRRAYTSSDNKAQVFIKSLLFLTLPTLMLANIYKDDEDYKKIRKGIRDNYWLLKTEWFTNDPADKGKFIRIPKPREIAFIFSSLVDRTYDWYNEDEDAWYDIDTTFKNMFVPSLRLVVAPLSDVWSNKNWFGIPIVPQRLQNLPVDEQYDETTSNLAIWLAKVIPDALGPYSSPKNIDYLIDQFSGVIGDIALPLTTPSENAIDELIFRRTSSDVAYSNDKTQQFYDILTKLESAHYAYTKNYSITKDLDEPMYKKFSKFSNKLSKAWKLIRDIQSSDDFTDEEKEEYIREIRLQILEFTTQAVDFYNEYTKEKKELQK